MATRKSRGSRPGKVIAFPPLPVIPRPPRLPSDPRQRRAAHVVGAIAAMAHPSMRLTGPNFASGFDAAAVDVGRLQTALGRGISHFDMRQIEARWNDVRAWMLEVLRVWVQRCQRIRIERRESGVRIELETQDDRGYYSYGFDVFPGKGRP
jgi:hypothetical protein